MRERDRGTASGLSDAAQEVVLCCRRYSDAFVVVCVVRANVGYFANMDSRSLVVVVGGQKSCSLYQMSRQLRQDGATKFRRLASGDPAEPCHPVEQPEATPLCTSRDTRAGEDKLAVDTALVRTCLSAAEGGDGLAQHPSTPRSVEARTGSEQMWLVAHVASLVRREHFDRRKRYFRPRAPIGRPVLRLVLHSHVISSNAVAIPESKLGRHNRSPVSC